MIISGKQVQDVVKLYTDQKQSKPAARPQRSAAKQDEVVLSPQAQEFSQLLQKLKTMPEVREDKVAELTARIESGEYKVSARDIAEKMLADRLW